MAIYPSRRRRWCSFDNTFRIFTPRGQNPFGSGPEGLLSLSWGNVRPISRGDFMSCRIINPSIPPMLVKIVVDWWSTR